MGEKGYGGIVSVDRGVMGVKSEVNGVGLLLHAVSMQDPVFPFLPF